MKILSGAEIRRADQYTIQHEPISSIHLMERAANMFVHKLTLDYDLSQFHIHIFCGTGNNGGDGLAIARLLYQKEYQVKAYWLRGKQSEDFTVNFKRLEQHKKLQLFEIKNTESLPVFSGKDIIIDAIFGIGLNRPAEGLIKNVLSHLNDSNAVKVSVDIPSGMYADKPNHEEDIIFQADKVYTFHAPKLPFLLPQYAEKVKDFSVLDIGLRREFTEHTDSNLHYTELGEAKTVYRKRNKFSHKGTYGHSLLIAGSEGKMGAAVLSAKANLRAGSGLLTVHLPLCGLNIMQASLPEAMCSTDDNNSYFTALPELSGKTIGIGPGIGTEKGTQNAFHQLLKKANASMVIDADALNILSQNPNWINLIPQNSILTPHPKEFERLVGSWANDFERLEIQRNFSIRHQVILVLKGAHTSISSPDGNIFFNSTGNNGMATAGSGDVLTGILTALLAQSYPSLHAAVLGVYIHGLAGDLALNAQSLESLTASDIIDNLGNAFKQLNSC